MYPNTKANGFKLPLVILTLWNLFVYKPMPCYKRYYPGNGKSVTVSTAFQPGPKYLTLQIPFRF